MELRINEQGQELKVHGTYGFPVNVGRKRVSSYATGSFPWHWHDEVEFTLVFSGAMEYRVNESGYILRAGEGLFCNADALHTGGKCSDGEADDCDYLSITVHPRFLYGYEGSVIRTKYVAGVVVSSVHLTEAVPWQQEALSALREIYNLLLEKPEGYELSVQRRFLEIWSGLYRHYAIEAQNAPVEDPEKLQRLRALLSFLHAHYQEKLTLEDAARQVNLSKSECCRFFKKQMGLSIFDYLLDYRVGQSLKLLKSGKTVAEAAAEAGFSSPAYFAKVFRAHTGRSPRQYRREAELSGRSAP